MAEQLPVIEQYAPAPPAATAAADGVSMDDAEGALAAMERFSRVLERVSGSMVDLLNARAQAAAARRQAPPPPQAQPDVYQSAPDEYGMPPPPMMVRPMPAAWQPTQQMEYPMEQPASYAVPPAPPPELPVEPAPAFPDPAPAPAPLTDDQIDRVFDLAIDWATRYPDTTFRDGAEQIAGNRGLLRDVVRKAIAEDG